MNDFLQLVIYIFCVLVSMYGFYAFKLEDYMKKNKTSQAIVFYFVVSLSLGYLLAQFMFAIARISL